MTSNEAREIAATLITAANRADDTGSATVDLTDLGSHMQAADDKAREELAAAIDRADPAKAAPQEIDN